jgi:hypothetical protein
MPLSIHAIYRQVFKIWRVRRFKLFLRLMHPTNSEVLIDVGGYPGSWTGYLQPVKRIDILNIHKVGWDDAQFPRHNIRILLGDGCSLKMPDRSYDIAFSNSVIEHVGSWEHQQRFAREIRRVAWELWVQTPAYECPIEPHYMTPLIHYLPRSWQKRLLRWCTVWGWLEHPAARQVNEMVETTRLLRKSEMKLLFPDCEILTERLLWLIPKSYIAVRRKPALSVVVPGNSILAAQSQPGIFTAAKAQHFPERSANTGPCGFLRRRRFPLAGLRPRFFHPPRRLPGPDQ